MDIISIRPLPGADYIKKELPVSDKMQDKRLGIINEIQSILSGSDRRLLIVVGPCSSDREKPVLDYLEMLAKLREQVKDRILIIPRIYSSKPRSKGTGYMGMSYEPEIGKGPDLIKGIYACRSLYIKALDYFDFSGADELLYPDQFTYMDDLVSYLTVGARSVSNQFHRLFASGLGLPVAMKNPDLPFLDPMINAVHAARQEQVFAYKGYEVKSKGNPYVHCLLRGFRSVDSHDIPNYSLAFFRKTLERFNKLGVAPAGILIDCNHSNSGKNFLKQVDIANEVIDTIGNDKSLNKYFKGLMIESYIMEGSQNEYGKNYGQSITDPCLDFARTADLIKKLADKWDSIN